MFDPSGADASGVGAGVAFVSGIIFEDGTVSSGTNVDARFVPSNVSGTVLGGM